MSGMKQQKGFGKWHHDTIGKFENRPTDTGAGATLIDRTKAAHDATALEYQHTEYLLALHDKG